MIELVVDWLLSPLRGYQKLFSRLGDVQNDKLFNIFSVHCAVFFQVIVYFFFFRFFIFFVSKKLLHFFFVLARTAANKQYFAIVFVLFITE